MQNQPLPLILSFGVCDPVGALGVQSDVAAFAALGCHGLSAIAGLLVSDSARVEHMYELDSDWMAEQARALLEDMPIAAFKVGAVGTALHLAAIAEIVSDYPDAPLILDPFLSALPDAGMGDEEMLMALRSILAPQATALILSQAELGRMAELWRDGGDDDPCNLAEDVAELTSSGLQYVLVTGTRDTAGACSNRLFDASGEVARVDWQHLPGPFLGAGNTYSAAFTALMARGMDAPTALAVAQEYTTGALENAQRFGMGKFIPAKFFRP
ncbi:bifunctional hydroxymethylpyrimidine kinase/phosphomethylpyrimidine kinase [Oxalobacteraceae sp. CFBP 13730]|uniref:bifunctional hydroxymethylpyrimidine kinase/phosphomethylpyrimidine kinase n=1 Tax=Massilia sp. TaxID=1882437 RepID=UPI0019ADAEA7|nr:bifunctional hydroxymethylpyrimidine kinase/phosphomethylpyrimidine kinase [Oxalobacteraceae sp. CFBP 8761]MBD8564411.1 bifunctional hydroxymethylpyrimidine kinase/phosphomethylpyrimidine kinase [Oxalobacteraceae sp. CFBP 8763]MBD8625672.1 bifunctional hydroxymethylpyrimidine kinase/phosphomethylpyrimidine kinase [Oxalobacteraceae sp. CFBP 8753]MBD8630122.1 bifunctional hydroxymethylpyrimidine kinase/phosphomethylpyrimidine kinase [Oxalobacteraceae sp. CFBP 8755]MBD8657186.1 bifunctional hyd